MGKSKNKVRQRAPTDFKNSGYSEGGASRTSKILKAWSPIKLSPKTDIDMNLSTLRNRAFDMSINTPIGAAAINTSSSYVVGAGLTVHPRPKFKILGIDAQTAREWSQKTVEEFKLWASTVDCDVCRRNNFFDLQHIAYVSYLADGDAFALFKRKNPTPRNPYTLRLQLLESNRVSNPLDGTVIGVFPHSVEARAKNGNMIISGVEINDDGEIAAYYISNRVPNDVLGADETTKWVRVKAFGNLTGLPNVLQVCRDQRPDQFRGVPLLAPVIETLKQTSRYTNAELSSAIVKSFFSLFFVQPESNRTLDEMIGAGIGGQGKQDEPVVDVNEYNLGSGTLSALPKGVDVKAVDGGKSQSSFGVFTQELIKQIGAGLNIPYEVLMKSFTASYSASRAALLQAEKEFEQSRECFIRDFCQPVFEMWLIEAVASGRIEAPGFFDDPLIRAAWSNAEWYGTSIGQLDPVKEVQGAQLRIALGLSTHEKEAAEMTGTDFAENVEKLLEEQKMMEELQPEPTEITTEGNETDEDGDMEEEEDVQQRTDNG